MMCQTPRTTEFIKVTHVMFFALPVGFEIAEIACLQSCGGWRSALQR